MELKNFQNTIDQVLKDIVDKSCDGHPFLNQAACYSLLAPGKRIRPYIVILLCELFQKSNQDCYFAAAALELIHTYSLIHDDLPSMDDDDYRRGQLSSHKAFGEATAILVGDYLLTTSFEVLSQLSCSLNKRISLIQVLAKYSGGQGIVAGQLLDIKQDQNIEKIRTLKTASLFEAAFLFGAILSDCSSDEKSFLKKFGHELGLFFQIQDDCEDAPSQDNLNAYKKKQIAINHLIQSAPIKKELLQSILNSFFSKNQSILTSL